jgi:hypothetical protein
VTAIVADGFTRSRAADRKGIMISGKRRVLETPRLDVSGILVSRF